MTSLAEVSKPSTIAIGATRRPGDLISANSNSSCQQRSVRSATLPYSPFFLFFPSGVFPASGYRSSTHYRLLNEPKSPTMTCHPRRWGTAPLLPASFAPHHRSVQRVPERHNLSFPLSLVLHCSRAQPLTIIHQHEILETMAQRSGEPALVCAARPSARNPPPGPRRRRPPGRSRVYSRKPSSNYFRRLYFFVSDLEN